MAENKVLQGLNLVNRGLQGPQLNIEDNRGYRDRSVRPVIIILCIISNDIKKSNSNNNRPFSEPTNYFTNGINYDKVLNT